MRASLAWYMATSARCSSVVGVGAVRRGTARRRCSRPSRPRARRSRTASAARRRSRRADARPPARARRPAAAARTRRRRGGRRARCSPTASCSRGAELRRAGRSPAWWPSVSLSSLKRSRSTIATASGASLPRRAPRASRSWNSAAVGEAGQLVGQRQRAASAAARCSRRRSAPSGRARARASRPRADGGVARLVEVVGDEQAAGDERQQRWASRACASPRARPAAAALAGRSAATAISTGESKPEHRHPQRAALTGEARPTT